MARPRKIPIINSDEVQISHSSAVAPPEIPLPFEAGDILVEGSKEFINHHAKLRNDIARRVAKQMEEKITIVVEPDQNPDAPSFVPSTHNGNTQWILRGQPQEIKRKYVASLLAGKRITINASYGKDPSGKEINHMTSSAQGTYRVTLVEDNHPGGGTKWFRDLMALPA